MIENREILKKIKVVIIDNLFSQIDNSEVLRIFTQGILARVRGYRSEYPKSFMPLDGADWIDRHYFFCEERDGQLQPIGGFRFTFYSRCQYYRMPFPLAVILKNANSPFLGQLENEISLSLAQKKDVIFGAWLTLDKKYRGQKEVSAAFHRLYGAMYCDLYDKSNGSPAFGGAVLQFKTRRWLERVGHQVMTYEGNPSGVFRNPYSGFDIVLLKMEKPSLWARESEQEVGEILKNAIYFGESESTVLKIAA